MTVTLSPTPVLETERLVLRAPQAADWAAWRDFFLTERGQWIRSMSNPTPKDAWRTFAAVTGHWVLRGWGMFVITKRGTDQGVGIVGPWMPEGWPEAEISWSLWAPQAEGQGYMTEAAHAVIAHAFHDLGWTTAVSYIDPNNIRSTALAQRLGATPRPGCRIPRRAADRSLASPRTAGGHRMSDPTTRAADLLAEHRESIDRLDAVLIYTLAERFAQTKAVGKLKAEHALPPSDPAREATQIARLETLALQSGLDPEFAKKFLNFVISEVIRHHEKLQK